MATKAVTFCDVCDKAQAAVGSILPTFFTQEGQELCYTCASAQLRKMYAVDAVEDMAVDKEAVPKSAFEKEREELIKELGCAVYVIRPKVEVAKGMVIKYGNPLRDAEVIKEVTGKEGEWFAKLVG
jgi:hypothetical protein